MQNWDTPQTITITGLDDSDVDGDIDVTITVAVDDALSDAAMLVFLKLQLSLMKIMNSHL